jgi:hypothetical protein
MMISERQRHFRETYLSHVSPRYSGILHVAVIFAAGIAAIAWCVSQMRDASWEWLLAIPVFLGGNFVEWFVHRYVMHRRINLFALRAIYERHTRQHHQYFTDNEPTFDTIREFRIVFFPWRILATLAVSGMIFGGVAALIFDANAGYVVFITMVGSYLIYEFFHCCCHVHDNWFVRNTPFINTIRRHHIAHHNQGIMMKYNMSLTFPIADWFMGTSDLDRGLFGNLFNGYSEKHVKQRLKEIIGHFRRDDSRVTLDGPRLTADEEKVLAAGRRRAPIGAVSTG